MTHSSGSWPRTPPSVFIFCFIFSRSAYHPLIFSLSLSSLLANHKTFRLNFISLYFFMFFFLELFIFSFHLAWINPPYYHALPPPYSVFTLISCFLLLCSLSQCSQVACNKISGFSISFLLIYPHPPCHTHSFSLLCFMSISCLWSGLHELIIMGMNVIIILGF